MNPGVEATKSELRNCQVLGLEELLPMREESEYNSAAKLAATYALKSAEQTFMPHLSTNQIEPIVKYALQTCHPPCIESISDTACTRPQHDPAPDSYSPGLENTYLTPFPVSFPCKSKRKPDIVV
jgi:hypothetical protein